MTREGKSSRRFAQSGGRPGPCGLLTVQAAVTCGSARFGCPLPGERDYLVIELPAGPDGRRRRVRLGGYATCAAAQSALGRLARQAVAAAICPPQPPAPPRHRPHPANREHPAGHADRRRPARDVQHAAGRAQRCDPRRNDNRQPGAAPTALRDKRQAVIMPSAGLPDGRPKVPSMRTSLAAARVEQRTKARPRSRKNPDITAAMPRSPARQRRPPR